MDVSGGIDLATPGASILTKRSFTSALRLAVPLLQRGANLPKLQKTREISDLSTRRLHSFRGTFAFLWREHPGCGETRQEQIWNCSHTRMPLNYLCQCSYMFLFMLPSRLRIRFVFFAETSEVRANRMPSSPRWTDLGAEST